MKPWFAAVALGALAPLAAQAVEYNSVLADKSVITFTSKQMNVPVNGRFPKFTAQLSFDPAKPDAAKLNLTIDTASIDAGSPDANGEVVGKPWFNVAAFPTASFVAGKVKAIGANRYEVSGKLTIKGRSQDLTIPASFQTSGANGAFDGSFTLKRADFAIGEGEWADFSVVANEVQIKFHVVAAAGATKK